MSLKPGCRFTVAPRFHIPGDWAGRLLIGSGVDEVDGAFFPRDSWRAPTPDELSMLVGSAASPGERHSCFSLFKLPEHLAARWWTVLETAAGAPGKGGLPGFDSFAGDIREVLEFKGMAPPDGASFGVILTDPAQRSTQAPTRHPAGLLGDLAARSGRSAEPPNRWTGPWAAINLGDEATSVLLINLPLEQMRDELSGEPVDAQAPSNPAGVAARFLRRRPDYPPVRLILEPGHGCRFPDQPMVLDGYLAGQREPDVHLLIARDQPA